MLDDVEIYINEAVVISDEYEDMFMEDSTSVIGTVKNGINMAITAIQTLIGKILDFIDNFLKAMQRMYQQHQLERIIKSVNAQGASPLLDKKVQTIDFRKQDRAFEKAIQSLNEARNKANFEDKAIAILDRYKKEAENTISFLPVRLLLKRLSLSSDIALKVKDSLNKDKGVLAKIAQSVSTSNQYDKFKRDVDNAANNTIFYKYRVLIYNKLTEFIEKEAKTYYEASVKIFKKNTSDTISKMVVTDPDMLNKKLSEHEEKYKLTGHEKKIHGAVDLALSMRKHI